MPINSNHKLQEWYLPAWDGLYPSLNVNPIRNEQSYECALCIYPSGRILQCPLLRKLKALSFSCKEQRVFSFLPLTKVNVTRKTSLASQQHVLVFFCCCFCILVFCIKETRKVYRGLRCGVVISKCENTVFAHLFPQLLGETANNQHASSQAVLCTDLQPTRSWAFFIGNVPATKAPEQLLAGSNFRRQWPVLTLC